MGVLANTQKKKDFVLRSVSEETKCSQACAELYAFLKPFFVILLKDEHRRSSRVRVFYSLSSRLIEFMIEHYAKYTVNAEGAAVISGDVTKYNELFVLVESAEVKRLYEKFRLLANIYILDAASLQDYITEHLLRTVERRLVAEYLGKRSDFKANKLEAILKNLQ